MVVRLVSCGVREYRQAVIDRERKRERDVKARKDRKDIEQDTYSTMSV